MLIDDRCDIYSNALTNDDVMEKVYFVSIMARSSFNHSLI